MTKQPRKRKRGRALLTAAVGMAVAGFGLSACSMGTVALDCDAGDQSSVYCLKPDAGPTDGG